MASKPKQVVEVLSPSAALIDELGDLEKELAPLKAKISRAETLRKLLRAAVEDAPATDEVKAVGSRYIAIFAPRGNQTVIDYPLLVKELKPPAFAKFATCTLAALRDNAPAELVGKVTRMEPTGPRGLTLLAKS